MCGTIRYKVSVEMSVSNCDRCALLQVGTQN